MAECVTRRCKQIGKCNCLHIYNDGTPVPGSGVFDDPYVHESARVDQITRSNGLTLTVDEKNCVTLPKYIKSILLEESGVVLFPDSEGKIQVPDKGMAFFRLRDHEANELIISRGQEILVNSDGDASTNYVINGYEQPTILGGAVVFPQLKSKRYQGEAVLYAAGSALSSGGGARNIVSNINFGRNKTTKFLVSGHIVIYTDPDRVLSQNDHIGFQVTLSPAGGTSGNGYPTEIVTPFDDVIFTDASRYLYWNRAPGSSSIQYPINKMVTRPGTRDSTHPFANDSLGIYSSVKSISGSSSAVINFNIKVKYDFSVTSL